MADIAVVFHWMPDALDSMPLGELLSWRHQAYTRSGAKEHE